MNNNWIRNYTLIVAVLLYTQSMFASSCYQPTRGGEHAYGTDGRLQACEKIELDFQDSQLLAQSLFSNLELGEYQSAYKLSCTQYNTPGVNGTRDTGSCTVTGTAGVPSTYYVSAPERISILMTLLGKHRAFLNRRTDSVTRLEALDLECENTRMYGLVCSLKRYLN